MLQFGRLVFLSVLVFLRSKFSLYKAWSHDVKAFSVLRCTRWPRCGDWLVHTRRQFLVLVCCAPDSGDLGAVVLFELVLCTIKMGAPATLRYAIQRYESIMVCSPLCDKEGYTRCESVSTSPFTATLTALRCICRSKRRLLMHTSYAVTGNKGIQRLLQTDRGVQIFRSPSA